VGELERSWMLSRLAAPAEKLKNPAAPAENCTDAPSLLAQCAMILKAACSLHHSWAAASTQGMAKFFPTLEGCMRHLPS